MHQVPEKKVKYGERFLSLSREYKKILLVQADNVGSKHFQKIRMDLRGRAIILMGKNTILRKVIRENEEEYPALAQLLPCLVGNIGMVFTNEDIVVIRDLIDSHKIGAAARVGAVAPCDVFLPAGPTGLEPGQTSFLQALDIPTMISRGQIEIKNEVHLIKKGNRVNASQAALLVKLDQKPFEYGLIVEQVMDDGLLFDAAVLDLSDDDLLTRFNQGVRNIAAVSLALGLPTLASVPHSVINAFKNILAISLATSYTFKQSEEIKALLDDPEKLAALAAAAASAGGAAPAAAAAEPEPEAAKEESEEDIGGGLFGDDDDDDGDFDF
eukprot:CAMPEP_0119118980 /NCGR_PEP_ID=MMETSP1310-20130426/672_1 /TAXON_ID=464262 /ORGANISM="Genus nov. species nov., Strain RCC2339" /LENGTH=325 /DNA_ID=CAMNT_0007108389 /DNA_START=172 /DNA_END=1149 /DNA_ORIENTATION=-